MNVHTNGNANTNVKANANADANANVSANANKNENENETVYLKMCSGDTPDIWVKPTILLSDNDVVSVSQSINV